MPTPGPQPTNPYVPRLTDAGIVGNPYWYDRSPFYPENGLPNCTCYAWGRWWENSDINHDYSNRPNLGTGDAYTWFGHEDGYERGSTPALGAVACYSGGIYSGLGHVCVVEEIDAANNRCLVSESAYNGYFFRASHYISMSGDYGEGGYTFQGFIYNPITGGGGGPIPTGKKLWLLKRSLWHKEENLLI